MKDVHGAITVLSGAYLFLFHCACTSVGQQCPPTAHLKTECMLAFLSTLTVVTLSIVQYTFKKYFHATGKAAGLSEHKYTDSKGEEG